MRVLVVDDQGSIRALIKAVLRSIDINDIEEAINGAQALQKLRDAAKPFQLVINDWHMPEMSGLQLLAAIRADEKLFRLRVIMLTSEHSREHVLEATALQVQGYVVKPFKPETLIKSIEAAAHMPAPSLIPLPPPAPEPEPEPEPEVAAAKAPAGDAPAKATPDAAGEPPPAPAPADTAPPK